MAKAGGYNSPLSIVSNARSISGVNTSFSFNRFSMCHCLISSNSLSGRLNVAITYTEIVERFLAVQALPFKFTEIGVDFALPAPQVYQKGLGLPSPMYTAADTLPPLLQTPLEI